MRRSEDSIDNVDRAIVQALWADAHRSASDIGADDNIKLSGAAVRRRIARLKKLGVITRFTVVVDYGKLDQTVEAYVLVTFKGGVTVRERVKQALTRDEVREGSVIAGEIDAVIRVRVRDLDHLLEVVEFLGALDDITSTKTLVSLGRTRSTPGRLTSRGPSE